MKYIYLISILVLGTVDLYGKRDKGIVIDRKVTYAGQYEWQTDNSEASLTIRKVSKGKYQVSGEAFYGIKSKYGPNFGILEFTAVMKDNTIRYRYDDYELILKFSANSIEAEEFGARHPDFGMNVFFTGKFKKVQNKQGSKSKKINKNF